MHLVCLGVMRKLVYLWVKSKKIKRPIPTEMKLLNYGRLSPHQILEVSNSLENMKSHISEEFRRKPRSLVHIDKWKATEFRQLLLYTGPVVLKDVLDKNSYSHFLVLHCAIRILCEYERQKDLIDYANSLLKCFVEGFSSLYGKEFVSYNVHGLLHMCEDVVNFGSLDNYSAFQFENYMQSIKKLLRKAEKPLPQIVRRILEMRNLSEEKSTSKISIKVTDEHFEGPLIAEFNFHNQYKKLNFKNFCFSTSRPDNICKLLEGDIVEIENIVMKDQEVFIIGKKFLKGTDFFTQPCQSSLLGICMVEEKGKNLSFWPLNRISNKCLLLPYKTGFVVMPLSGINE